MVTEHFLSKLSCVCYLIDYYNCPLSAIIILILWMRPSEMSRDTPYLVSGEMGIQTQAL